MPPATTTERLQQSAMELFEEHGYENVSAEAIAEACGVSRRTFFRHFASKDMVVFAAHADRVEALAAAIASHGELAPTAAVREGCLDMARAWDQDAALHMREWRVVHSSSALVARELELDRSYERVMAEALSGGEANCDHRLVASILMGAIRGALRVWRLGGTGLSLEALGARAFALAIDGVGVVDRGGQPEQEG